MWAKLSFASERPLGSWVDNLRERVETLEDFKSDNSSLPLVVSLHRLFCPEAFLTAILQVCAQEKKIPLNDLFLRTEVTKIWSEQAQERPSEGA